MFTEEEKQGVLDSMSMAQKKIDEKLMSDAVTQNSVEFEYWQIRKEKLESAIESWNFIMNF